MELVSGHLMVNQALDFWEPIKTQRVSCAVVEKHKLLLAGTKYLMMKADAITSLIEQGYWVKFTFSGVTSDPVHATMITSTIIVVFFTTLVFGFLTRPLISAMIPPRGTTRTLSRGLSTGSNSPKDDFTLPFLSTEADASGSGIVLEQAKKSISMLLERPVHMVHINSRKFDDNWEAPVWKKPLA